MDISGSQLIDLSKQLACREISVMAWIENRQGEVLLVRQATGSRRWALPGGKVKRSEPLSLALKREVKEETGLIVASLEPVEILKRSPSKLTVLFLVETVRPKTGWKIKATSEILGGRFCKKLPTPATMSAKHFWDTQRFASAVAFESSLAQ